MKRELEDFFKELAKIQDEQTNAFLCRLGKFDDGKLRESLENFSYEIIYKIMELLDGYYDSKKKYEVKNVFTNTIVNDRLDFHDLCEDFLKCS
ncbi:MAG: hypothetical protein J6X11_12135 [Treponema sp.]|nr:hypothetical protein [Treponema sp.]MBP5747864.1 hypothetical protein [Treponema sp.]